MPAAPLILAAAANSNLGPETPCADPMFTPEPVEGTMSDLAADVNVLIQREEGRAALLASLGPALDNGDIYLVYQPKLHLRSGAVESVEALLRWDHPEFGSISPPVLIELVERAKQVEDLTLWVLRRAMAEQKALAKAGRILLMYVNVSGSLLSNNGFVDRLWELGTAGGIGIDVNETAIIEQHEIAASNLKRLRDLGFALSIDDYGSGLSSLVYLKDLPASELKIDKQFISGMAASHRDPLIVRSTIDLAHALGMTVVAEGVESLATLALLRVMGCDYGQGFLISRPVRAAGLIDFLALDEHRRLLDTAAYSLPPPQSFWTRTQRELPSDGRRLDKAS